MPTKTERSDLVRLRERQGLAEAIGRFLHSEGYVLQSGKDGVSKRTVRADAVKAARKARKLTGREAVCFLRADERTAFGRMYQSYDGTAFALSFEQALADVQASRLSEGAKAPAKAPAKRTGKSGTKRAKAETCADERSEDIRAALAVLAEALGV